MTLPHFISALRSVGLNPDAESLADFFFYAAYLPSAASQEAKDQQPTPAPSDTDLPSDMPPSSSTGGGTPAAPPLPPDRVHKKSGLFPATAAGQEGTVPAEEIEVPEAPALPSALEIARSLRPLSRQFPIPGLGNLDEEATAELSANQRQLLIAFRQRRERWFDVALVVEDTPSMAIWKQTIAAFERLLASHGAFRDVRRWHLTADGSLTNPSGEPATPNTLLSPSGRRVLLILTHGVSTAWQSPALAAAVSEWARHQPTAVIQLLPTRLWGNSRLGEPKAVARSTRPGLPNSQWDVAVPSWLRRSMSNALPLPILTLDPESVGNWANMLMARSSAAVPAAYWSVSTVPAPANPTQTDNPTAEQRLDSFNRIAVDDGRRLAAVLSAGPINLPILRLVNQTIFGEKARNETIAQVLLGGILRKMDDPPADPEQVEYDFYPGLRILFAASLHSDDRFAVRRQVMQYLLQHPDTTQRFRVLVPHKNGKRLLPEWAMPFADEDDEFLRNYQLAEDINPDERTKAAIEPETFDAAKVSPDAEFDEFLRHLPAFLVRQRWFRGKTRSISGVSIRDWAKSPFADFSLAFVAVEYSGDSAAEAYVLPMSKRNGTWSRSPYNEDTWSALFALIDDGVYMSMDNAAIQSHRGKNYESIRGPRNVDLNPFSDADAERLSVRFGDRLLMKIYPRVEGEPNPNVEMCRYFSEEAEFPQAVPYAGSLELVYRDGETASLALLHGTVKHSGNAWARATDELEDPSLRAPFVRTLARRIAQMHAALAAGMSPAFAPKQPRIDYLSELADQMLEHAFTVLVSNSESAKAPPEMSHLLNEMSRVEAVFHRARALPPTFSLIRIHGDLHLNQLLRTADDFVFPDFDGDQSQSLAQRRSKQCALKDLASMIRSISYLANVGRQDMRPNPWEYSVTEQFIAAYRQEAGPCAFLPADTDTFDVLLDAFLLDKAFRELAYELANRPSWARIPLKAILELMDAPEPQQTKGDGAEKRRAGETVREVSSRSAVIFIDTGTLDEGWSVLRRFLSADESLTSWSLLTFSLSNGIMGRSPNDVNLADMAIQLKLQLMEPGLPRHDKIAFVAHDIGGLVLQRALLDNPEIVGRTTHLFLFGTPSTGVRRSRPGLLSRASGSWVSADSLFIRTLRENWANKFGATLPFRLYAITGEMDQVVPPESSFDPFPMAARRVVPGDHTSMVRPKDANDAVVRLLVTALSAPTGVPAAKEKLTAQQWFYRGYNSTDPDEQILSYTEAIRLKPDDYAPYYNRAIAHTEKGDLHRAIDSYNAAIILNSDDADAFMNRAMVRADLGDLDKALQDYDTAVRLNPTDADILMNRGVLLAEKGDLPGALQDYNVVVQLRPTDADAFYNRANTRSEMGDQDGALADYNESLRLNPDNPGAFRYRAEILSDQGDLDGALNDLNQLARLSPDDADVAGALSELADRFRARGYFDKAESLYNQSLAINKKAFGENDSRVAFNVNNLGLTYSSQGKFADAESALRQALAIWEQVLGPNDPNVATALNNLAEVYRNLGSLAQSAELYHRSLAISERAFGPVHPNVAMALNNLGLLKSAQGNKQEAELLHRRALAIFEQIRDDRSIAMSFNNIGSLYSSVGRYEEAQESLYRALAIYERVLGPDHPDTATCLNNLADVQRNLGRFGEAESVYKRALAINEKALGPTHPNVAMGLRNLAVLFTDAGRYGEAKSLYHRALGIYESTLDAADPRTVKIRSELDRNERLSKTEAQ
jgi:tetratricopeptide (TPR) repeat protein/predicted trehalose synthase